MLAALPRKWWIAFFALAAGAALRLWFIHAYPEVQGDPLIYADIAKNWMLHGGYGLSGSEGIRPTLIRLPGYPLFLVLCFRLFGMEHYGVVLAVQCVIDLFTCFVIASLANRLFGRRAGFAALWLSALCPFMATYTAAPLTEV